MNFFEDMMNKREARLKSPAFIAEMAKEKMEFKSILKDLGSNTLDAGYGVLLKTPGQLFMNSMKAIYNKKYGAEAFTKDAFKLFFGKDGVFHNITKVTANAIHLSGKTVKMGVRQLFAI
jgi:hypothetical protein